MENILDTWYETIITISPSQLEKEEHSQYDGTDTLVSVGENAQEGINENRCTATSKYLNFIPSCLDFIENAKYEIWRISFEPRHLPEAKLIELN